MIRIFLLLIVTTFLSCSKEESCDEIKYSDNIEAQQGEEYCFEDGNTFLVTSANDNLCPCNTICAHIGYISANVELVLDGTTYTGEVSVDPNLNVILPELDIPANYKFALLGQEPTSETACGGEIKAEDFKFIFAIKKQ